MCFTFAACHFSVIDLYLFLTVALVGLYYMTVSFSGHNKLLFQICKRIKLITTAIHIVKINMVRDHVVS